MPTLYDLLKNNKSDIDEFLKQYTQNTDNSSLEQEADEDNTSVEDDSDLLESGIGLPLAAGAVKKGASKKPIKGPGVMVGENTPPVSQYTKEDIANLRIKNALDKQGALPVEGPQIPAGIKQEMQMSKLEPSFNMVESTPDISSKLEQLDKSSSKALQNRVLQNLQRSSDIPNVSSKLEELNTLGRLSPYSNVGQAEKVLEEIQTAANKPMLSAETLANLPDSIKRLLSTKAAQNAGKIAGKGLAALSIPLELSAARENFKKGEKMDAAANLVGAGSGAAYLVGSAAAAPLGVGSLSYAVGKGVSDAMGGEYKGPAPDDGVFRTPEIIDPETMGKGKTPKVLVQGTANYGEEFGPAFTPTKEDEKEKVEMPSPESFADKETQSSSESNSPSTDLSKLLFPENTGFTNATVANALAAQQAANNNALIANLGKAGATIGTGVAGAISKLEPPKNVSESFYEQLSKEAQAPVKTFEAATEAEKSDPNSTFSVNFRNFIKPITDKLGFILPENASAEQVAKVMPQLANIYNQKIAEESKLENTKLRMEQLKQSKQESAKRAEDKEFDTNVINFNKTLNTALNSSRGNIGKMALIDGGAERLKGLILSHGDDVAAFNKLTPQQAYEIAKTTDAMLSLGSPTISGTDKLDVQTFRRQAADLFQKYGNKPVPAGMGKFIKLSYDLLKREQNIARTELNKFYEANRAAIPDRQYKARKEEYDRIMKSRIFESVGDQKDLLGDVLKKDSDFLNKASSGYMSDISAPKSDTDAIEKIESNKQTFDKQGNVLKSPAGAYGPMQLLPSTAQDAAKLAGVEWNPNLFFQKKTGNTEQDKKVEDYHRTLGKAYYDMLLKKYDGDKVKAVAAYNAGMGKVDKLVAEHGENFTKALPNETKNYINKFKSLAGKKIQANGKIYLVKNDAGDLEEIK